MHEDAILVCEGKCNPDIKDYDATVGRIMQAWEGKTPFRSEERLTIYEWGRKLVHTAHIAVSNVRWAGRGWTRTWKCAECGQNREF